MDDAATALLPTRPRSHPISLPRQSNLEKPLILCVDTREQLRGIAPADDIAVSHASRFYNTPNIASAPQGESFVEVCARTDLFEGSVIRATRRLDELMGELATAAAIVGDLDLEAKFRASSATIRRDIMFAASLYI